MKYPCIVSPTHNDEIKVLVYGQFNGANAIHIDGPHKGKRVNYCTDNTEDITREYLTNTYGKCESQEHADFICELADKAGFSFCNDYKNIHNHFWFDDSHMEFDEAKEPIKAKAKQITIPMPPKELPTTATKDAEATIAITDTTPTVNDCSVDRDFYSASLNSDTTNINPVTFKADSIKVFDSQGNEIFKSSDKPIVSVDVVGAKISTAKDKPLNNGDNLLFGGEDNCKEWPSIGDEVLSDGIKWEVAAEYKRMVMLVTDDDCCFKVADKRECGKPKTPEEGLRDELIGIWNDEPDRDSIISAVMAKYNITKKAAITAKDDIVKITPPKGE